jgi:hypothetical protein
MDKGNKNRSSVADVKKGNRMSMPDVMLQMRQAVQENQELKKEVAALKEANAALKEANALMRSERQELFERLAAAEAQLHPKTELQRPEASDPVVAVAAGAPLALPVAASPGSESVSPPKAAFPQLQLGKLGSTPPEGPVSPRSGPASPRSEGPASPRSEGHLGQASPKRPPPRVPDQTSPRSVFVLSADSAVSDEPQGPSPRFEPLEEFEPSPMLSRDSSRRRPPPPPPPVVATAAAAPAVTPAVLVTSPGPAKKSVTSPVVSKHPAAIGDSSDANGSRTNFFKSSLKNTFGRSSKRPTEEDEAKEGPKLTRGSARPAGETPVLGRGSTRPLDSGPMSPRPEMKCVIGEVAHMTDGFKKVALYMITVTSRDGDEWKVARRYSQFLSLHQELQSKTSRSLTFPPKKFTLTMDESKLKQRTTLLQKFLDQLMEMPNLTSTMEFMRFIDPLESPSVLSLSYQEVTLSSDALVQIVDTPPFYQQLERQERFLMLVQAKLFVFRDENAVDALHIVALDYCVADFDGRMETGLFGFTVRHLTQTRPLLFEGEEDECRKWVAAIRQARFGSATGLAVQRPETSMPSSTTSSVVEEAEGRGAAVLRRFAHGKSVRLSTFSSVPDTVSSLMGTFSFSDADSPENVVVKDGVLSAGTTEKLIEKMTLPDVCTNMQLQCFVLTYRASLKPQELLAYLLARYHHSDLVESRKMHRGVGLHRNPVHDRVVLVLETWLELSFQDFVDDADLTARLMSFVYSALEGNILMNDGAERIKEIVKGRVLKSATDLAAEHERFLEAHAPKPLLPNMFGVGMSYLVDVDPLEIARQIAVLEHELFCRIRSQELIGQKWSKESLRPLAPNVMAVIARFNAVSAWTVSAVLQPTEAAVRAALIVRLTTIAHHLKEMRAYGPASAIVGGLLSPAVMRLKRSSELVDSTSQALLRTLEQLIAPEKNHKYYRELLHGAMGDKSAACCPYLGLYLADLTFIEDGNPDKRGEMINFDKRCMLGKVLREILRFQSVRYAFQPVPALQWFLANAGQASLSEKQAYDLSLEREPREKS